ncbi:MAG: hypothetical protein PHF56_06030 [Desulfuromonadaceae bacterium]|jgi:hypothetical protein|nr:hypothetical protein [Desulfuromonadaceae bacterium]MDD2733480.1 hypothetical protein [Desulfuromonadaceae bacterium]MDD5104350.1 hypothetical protein [Desulfuromonadaceae bacterium]MDD5104359.1 hypothetical protein [Desulfuromonadaceae bacterium]
MTGKTTLIAAASLLLTVMLHTEVWACRECGCNKTYNGYCNNQRWGLYGARKSVSSVEEARRDLTDYYADSDLKVGRIIEKPGYFEAELLDRNQKKADTVIINKRSGRIRSIQ